MWQQSLTQIVQLFHLPSKQTKKNVSRLVEQSFSILGQSQSLTLIKEWQKLSSKMCSLRQLQSLSDKNHRLLIIYFIKHEAVELYNNSYFNRAKIPDDYISFIKDVGPFHFAQIITIVSRLPLIAKHFQLKFNLTNFTQNHYDIKIMKILEMCNSQKRKGNTNLNKFQAIVEFQDERNELVKELGKMLRISWSLEKKQENKKQNQRCGGITTNANLINILESIEEKPQSPLFFSRQSQQLHCLKCGKE